MLANHPYGLMVYSTYLFMVKLGMVNPIALLTLNSKMIAQFIQRYMAILYGNLADIEAAWLSNEYPRWLL
jgi:hypothetical protein